MAGYAKNGKMNERGAGIFAAFVKYASLNVLGMIGLSCYILADTYYIANGLGANGLTALNLAIPVYSFISGLGLMIGMGGATRYSIWKGHSDRETTDRVFSAAAVFALCVSFFLFLIGLLWAEPLAGLLGADETVAADTSVYLRLILLFSPMFLMNNLLLCFVRNDGAPRLAMTAMLTGSFSNIVLDYIFIFPLGMGMFGAALATGFAPIISIAVLSVHFIKGHNQFSWRAEKVEAARLADISALGAASLITEISSGVVMIVFNQILLRIAGNMGVAAYGVIANIALVAIAIFNGLAQGIQPLLSSAYGSSDSLRLKRTYLYAMASSAVIAALIYAGSFFNAEAVVMLFNRENSRELLNIASVGMRLYFIGFVFVGINIITAVYFSSVDKPKQSFMVSMLRGFVLILPMVFFMPAFWGIEGVWLSFPFAEAGAAVVAAVLMGSRKEGKQGAKGTRGKQK